MGKKLTNNNSLISSAVLEQIGEPLHHDQKHSRLTVRGTNFVEGNPFFSVIGRSQDIEKDLDMLMDIAGGSLVCVNEYTFVYSSTSDRMDQKSVGYMDSSEPTIMTAISKDLKKITMPIPQLGTTIVDLSGIYGVSEYYRMKQVFHTVQLLPAQLGTIGRKLLMAKAFFMGHELRFDVRIRYSEKNDTWHRSIHDKAQMVCEALNNKDFDWLAYYGEKKEEFFQVKNAVRNNRYGETKALVAEKQPETVAESKTVIIVNGKQMKALEVPAGDFLMVDAKGKQRQNYTVSTNSDRYQLETMVMLESNDDPIAKVRLISK